MSCAICGAPFLHGQEVHHVVRGVVLVLARAAEPSEAQQLRWHQGVGHHPMGLALTLLVWTRCLTC